MGDGVRKTAVKRVQLHIALVNTHVLLHLLRAFRIAFTQIFDVKVALSCGAPLGKLIVF